eukprot:gene30164-35144_t
MASKRRHVETEEEGDPNKQSSLLSRKSTFKSYIIGLNQQFASWVEEQKSGHVAELWTDGIKDYLQHVDELLKDFSDLIDNERQSKQGKTLSAEPTTTPLASPAFSFGAAATPLTFSPAFFKSSGGAEDKGLGAEGTKDPPAPAAFGFGQAPPSFGTASTNSGPAAGEDSASEAPKPAFGFGAAAAATTTSSDAPKPPPAFAFGAATAAAKESAESDKKTEAPKPFAFGSSAPVPEPSAAASKPFSFGAAPEGAAKKDADAAPSGGGGLTAPAPAADEEDDAPAKFESELEVNEGAGTVVFKAKSKFFHFVKDGAGCWEGKGIGTMMVRQRGDDPKKAIITFTTEAGRVLYTTNLPKAMTVVLSETKSTASFSAHLEGRVLYITNLPKAMTVVLSETKSTASFSAPWAPEGGGATQTMQMTPQTVKRVDAGKSDNTRTIAPRSPLVGLRLKPQCTRGAVSLGLLSRTRVARWLSNERGLSVASVAERPATRGTGRRVSGRHSHGPRSVEREPTCVPERTIVDPYLRITGNSARSTVSSKAARALGEPPQSLSYDRGELPVPPALNNTVGHGVMWMMGYYSKRSRLLHGGQALYAAIKNQVDDGALQKGYSRYDHFQTDIKRRMYHSGVQMGVSRWKKKLEKRLYDHFQTDIERRMYHSGVQMGVSRWKKKLEKRLYDHFQTDIERRVYQCGVHMGVSKWTKKLEKVFYTSGLAFDKVLDGTSSETFADIILREFFGGDEIRRPQAEILSKYMQRELRCLKLTDDEQIFGGNIQFSKEPFR